ncbi:MAG: hypothetical protein J6H20_07195 [Pyramidobacter sp.]|nr:hypothetical protein [Pyramidobacter sp.]MBP3752392.1 hypothetical protein [Pyramidobacter sp.]
MLISFDTAKRRKARRGAGELISVSLMRKISQRLDDYSRQAGKNQNVQKSSENYIFSKLAFPALLLASSRSPAPRQHKRQARAQ